MQDVLTQLRDIHVPPPATWWPPAVGYWLVAVLALMLLAWVWHYHYRSRFRRFALREFDQLVEAYRRTDNGVEFAQNMSVLLRRIAVTLGPRERIAGLIGDEWFDHLEKMNTRSNVRFSDVSRDILETGIYRSGYRIDVEPLISECGRWIRALPARGRLWETHKEDLREKQEENFRGSPWR